MAEIAVQAVNRSDRGKNESRRLRQKGLVPGVVYGSGENIHIAVDPKALQKVLRSEAGRNAILKLEIEGHSATSAILKAWQVDPIKESFLHADFYRIAMDVALRVTVPIAIRGEAIGVKTEGGILESILREIEVECLPGDIPERIEIDVSELGLNRAIRVSELSVSEKVKILEDPTHVVVHVVSVKEEVVEAPVVAAPVEGAEAAAPAAPAEPEVLKKGKKEEEPPAE